LGSKAAGRTPVLFDREAGDPDPIDPKDVKQGNLSDCYFEASVNSLARTGWGRDAIRSAVRENRDANGKLTSWTVTLYRRETQGCADGYIPVPIPVMPDELGQDRSLRTDGGQVEVWPAVLGKAYEKLSGNHPESQDGGDPKAVLEALTGRPVDSHTYREWLGGSYPVDDLRGDLAHQKAIVLSTGEDGKVPDNMVANHAYSVVGLDEAAIRRRCRFKIRGRPTRRPLPCLTYPTRT
jgi:hypothetical protein